MLESMSIYLVVLLAEDGFASVITCVLLMIALILSCEICDNFSSLWDLGSALNDYLYGLGLVLLIMIILILIHMLYCL